MKFNIYKDKKCIMVRESNFALNKWRNERATYASCRENNRTERRISQVVYVGEQEFGSHNIIGNFASGLT